MSQDSASLQRSLECASSTADRVWVSAHVLAGALHEPDTPVDCRGLSVLELGAGCGVAGLSAWRGGAATVCLTELDENLPRLREIVAATATASVAGQVRVEALDWTQPLPAALVATPVDVVLGTDVVYWPLLFAPLLDTLAALPGSPRIVLCIVDRLGRASEFAARAKARGWRMRVLPYRPTLLPESHAEEARNSLFRDLWPGPDPQIVEMLQ
jgi:predicted nicotinamide N-methyase